MHDFSCFFRVFTLPENGVYFVFFPGRPYLDPPEGLTSPKRVKNARPRGVVGEGYQVWDSRLTTPSPPIIPPTPILGVF